MASQSPAQASNLQPGLPPQLVGALLPSGAMNSTPLPSGSLPRPPGLNKPRPVVASPSPAGGVTPNPVNRRAPGPEPISGWRVVYVAVVLVLAFLLLFGSDPLKRIVNLESARQHARNEGATLAFEKEKTEHERKMMARERELWEKARDARLPQGAFWDVVWPAWECLAYGKREYWGVLRNIPEGWDAMDACMNMPVEIKGVKLRRPNRCSHYFEFPERQVRGYWVVDWDQPDCKPWYRDFEDKGCTSYRSGKRRVQAQIMGINTKGKQDWRLLCKTTPLVWDMTTYTNPTECEERLWGKKFAIWEVPDETCRI